MTARALAVTVFASAFVLALVLLRPRPSTTEAADGVANAEPPPLAAATSDRAAIDAPPVPAPVAAAEAVEPTPAAAPLPTGFAPSVVADALATTGTALGPLAASLAEHERQFAGETVDRDWAPRVEAQILSGFAQQTGLKLTSLQVECRATLCRVQMTQPTRDGPPSTSFAFVEEMGLHAVQVLMIGLGNGEQSSVAYVSRFAPTPR